MNKFKGGYMPHKNIDIDFAEIVKSYRKKHNLKQVDVAKSLGISPAAYSKLEAGKNQPSFRLTMLILFQMLPELEASLQHIKFFGSLKNSERLLP